MAARRHVGRPRGGDPVETRRAILDAAEACFAASGFAGVTTRQVAALAGVNVATLHYHFGSKERLYRAVLDETTRKEIPLPGSARTPAERLSSAVEVLWHFGAAHPTLPRLRLFQRLADPRPSAGVLAAFEDHRATLLAQTLTEAGMKIPFSPAETARVILALLDGALVAAQEGQDPGEESKPDLANLSRDAVVAAALRVAGFA